MGRLPASVYVAILASLSAGISPDEPVFLRSVIPKQTTDCGYRLLPDAHLLLHPIRTVLEMCIFVAFMLIILRPLMRYNGEDV